VSKEAIVDQGRNQEDSSFKQGFPG